MKVELSKLCAIWLVFLVFCDISCAKRSSGGRSRSKSGSSTSWWGRRKTSGSGQNQPKPQTQNVKPSAPAEPAVKKETAKVQHSSPKQPQPQPPQPGWNVPGHNSPPSNTGWKSGYQTHGAPPAYQHHNAAPPAYNGQPTWGAPPAYPGHSQGYGGFGQNHHTSGGYGGYGGYNNHYPQQSIGGYNPGYGGMAMGGMGMGGMGMGGMGGGGFGGYGHQGGFGSSMGGFGGGYYPMKQKSSFFSGSTVSNVLAGMFVYSMASKLVSYGLGTKRPYTVVNYYNQEPNKKVEEIQLPANVLVLCEGNATELCGRSTQSICTQNGTVLCVATMNQASPCDQNGNSALCVNTTLPCADVNDPLCQNSTQKDKLEAEVSVPCFTNLTLDVNLADQAQTQPNTKYTYCITTMAIAGPEYRICDDITGTNDYRSVLNGNHDWFLESDGFRRNYSVYNAEKPMESNGEINMPVTALLQCHDNATKVCPPSTTPTCTNFNEIMCLVPTVDLEECSEYSSGCVKSTLPCPDGTQDLFCQNKTKEQDTISTLLPCFANITINAPFSKFNLQEFNGTFPDLTATSSYTYHFNFCVTTLALPGAEHDLCITKEAKEKQEKEQGKS